MQVGKPMEIKCDIKRELQDLQCSDRPKKYVSNRELMALDLGFTWDNPNAPNGAAAADPLPGAVEAPTISAVFLNRIEAWEAAAIKEKRKNSNGRYKVLRKYKGIHF